MSDVLLRTLGLVEDGDIQSKVLALHKEPHAIVNVNCRLFYDFLCDFNIVRFHGLLCASSFPSFPSAPGLSGVLFRDFAETDRFEPD